MRTVDLSLALPTITDPVTIDGYSQPGASRGTPPLFNDPVLLVELDCNNINGGECCAPGLAIQTSNCVVRGLVINRAPGPGLQLDGANNNLIEGNFIGTDPTGSLARGNGTDGILIQNSANNLIGGTNDWSQRNVISANSSNGVHVLGSLSTSNLLNGNCIGTDVTGQTGLSNFCDGVRIEGAAFNRVGVPGAATFNTISANGMSGVHVFVASSNVIQANVLGLDRMTRTVAIGNGLRELYCARGGVTLESASNNLVGGHAVDGNFMSGDWDGVILSNALYNVVGYNVIGLDGSKTRAVGNLAAGVFMVNSPTNTLGYLSGISEGAIIGGSIRAEAVGVVSSPGVSISGNTIGTDPGYTLNLGARVGIVISQSDGVEIGNRTGETGHGNVICNSQLDGLRLPNSRGCFVRGNFIGTDPTGSQPLGNNTGVLLDSQNSSNHQIGGISPGAANAIAFNRQEGVLFFSSFNISIRGNSIQRNGSLGISFHTGPKGSPTPNDPGDTDDGPNRLQNYPVLTAATNDGNNITIAGNLNSHPNTLYTLDFYANPECDPSGYGEGQWYLGAVTVITDVTGNAAFSIVIPAPLGTRFITATATDPDGNTSEFCQCAGVIPGITGSGEYDPTTGRFSGQLLWPGSAGDLIVIEATTNWVDWVPIATNTVDFYRSILFTDASAGIFSNRFYRAKAADFLCAASPCGLVSWWKAEGSAADSVGTNYGSLVNGLGFTSGEVLRAFEFVSAGQEVEVPASATLDVGAGPGFSLEGWINPFDSTNQYPLAEWNNGSNIGGHFWISVLYAGHGGPGSLYGSLTGAPEGIFASDPGIIQPGVWQHVAMTYETNSGVGRLYHNGIEVTNSTLGLQRPQTTFDLHLGNRPGGPTYKGALDEFTLYNRALTATELRLIYEAGSIGKCRP